MCGCWAKRLSSCMVVGLVVEADVRIEQNNLGTRQQKKKRQIEKTDLESCNVFDLVH